MDKEPEVNSDFVNRIWRQGPAGKCRVEEAGGGLSRGRGGGRCLVKQEDQRGLTGLVVDVADFLCQASGRNWTVDSDPGLHRPGLASPSPRTVTASAMLTPRTALLLTLLLAGDSLSQRARRPPQPPSPISTIPPKANFDAQQVQADRWVGRISPIWGPGPGSPSSPCALTWPAPSLQGRGSLWLWPPRAASCRSRATGLRPLYCVWLPSVQPWLSAPSRSCESPARTPAPTLAVAWTRVLWGPARVGALSLLCPPPAPQEWDLLAGAAALPRRGSAGPLPTSR